MKYIVKTSPTELPTDVIRRHLTVASTRTDEFTDGNIRSVFHTLTDRFPDGSFPSVNHNITDGLKTVGIFQAGISPTDGKSVGIFQARIFFFSARKFRL